jgi:hypothetical protein
VEQQYSDAIIVRYDYDLCMAKVAHHSCGLGQQQNTQKHECHFVSAALSCRFHDYDVTTLSSLLKCLAVKQVKEYSRTMSKHEVVVGILSLLS